MSEKSEKMFDGITRVGDDLVEAAQKAKKAPGIWKRWGALTVAAALLVCVGTVALRYVGEQEVSESAEAPAAAEKAVLRSETQDSQTGGAALLVAAAERPEFAQRPNEQSFVSDKGEGDWNAYNAAVQEWFEACQAQYEGMESYRGKLDGFLTKSIPTFLRGEPGENRVYSPLNVYLALAMLTETTDGASRAQLLDLLGAADTAELRELAKALWNANYLDDGVSTSLLSSSLWLNEDVDFVQDTMDRLASHYHASSFRGRMGSEDFNAALRQWLNENTGGLLNEQAEGIQTDENTLIELLTTIYLKAPWLKEFPEAFTKPDVFHAPDGDKTCDFLQGEAGNEYFRGKRFTAAEKSLMLGARRGAMWFLLPDEGVTPEVLLRDEEALRFLLTNKYEWREDNTRVWGGIPAVVTVRVPKFDADSKTDLVGGLKSLGVTDVFTPGAADFTPMIANAELLRPCVGSAQHAARVKIDEQGVVAAAFTEIGVEATGTFEAEPFELTLDRPFVFAITGADGLPLFVGVVQDPA